MTPGPADVLLARTGELLARAAEANDDVRHLLAIRLRALAAVDEALAAAGDDAAWAAALCRAMGLPFLDAMERRLDGSPVPAPWRLVLAGPVSGPERIRDVLVRAFVLERTYDLPLAILEVVPDHVFADPAALASRRDDLAGVDTAAAAALVLEDAERYSAVRAARRGAFARIGAPLSTEDARSLFVSSAGAAWRNAHVLNEARRRGPGPLRGRVDELLRRAEERLGEMPGRRVRWSRLTREGLTLTLDPG